MRLRVARTRDEAHLFLDLHPCAECGSVETAWDHALVVVDGELTGRYRGTCSVCGREREYLFALPEREVTPVGYPTFGGPEPSELIDAGEWLWVAELAAGNVPPDDDAEAGRALAIAASAVDEAIKFVPPGASDVPEPAFWSERGRLMREQEPSRFSRDALVAAREAFRKRAAARATSRREGKRY